MAVIRVEHLKKEFEYYKKGTGLQGSLRNLFHREMLKRGGEGYILFCGKGRDDRASGAERGGKNNDP